MELAALLHSAAAAPDADRRALYRALLEQPLWVRTPNPSAWSVTRPDDGRRALPAFLSEAAARAFWAAATPGAPAESIGVEPVPLADIARLAAEGVGALVLEPLDAGLLITVPDLRPLAAGEVPGDFAAWVREPARLGRRPEAVLAALRTAHVLLLAGPGAGTEPRLYLLGKSDDGSLALPCFTAADALAQFAEVRRLSPGFKAALYRGAEAERIAVGMGAILLVDPESPWETQLTPSLFRPI